MFFVERNLFVRQHCGHFPYSFLHILGIFRDYLQHCVGRRPRLLVVQLTIINEVVSYECQCEYEESEELEVFTNRDLFHP